jgi:hypothetical protein
LLCIDTPRSDPSKGALHAPLSSQPGALKWAACNAAVHESGVGNKIDTPYNNPSKGVLNEATCNVAVYESRVANKFGPQKNNLASLVRGLKWSIASKIRKKSPNFAWLSRFHDHIIRSDAEFLRIREYIENNPMNRDTDRNNVPL